jgi:RNA polymerase sigma-70 factor (ECF subfamily)
MGAARAAEDEAFGALFRATWAPLVRALSVAADPASAADAVQDAFVQAARHWTKVGAYDDPAAWVRHVALNRLRNQHRSRVRRDGALTRLGVAPARELEPTDLDLVHAVAALPEGQRLVVCLHHLADLSVAAVADALDISEGTVKSQLHDARAALRRTLEVTDG